MATLSSVAANSRCRGRHQRRVERAADVERDRASRAACRARASPRRRRRRVEPLMTSCPGALWLATTTTSPVSRCVSSHTAVAASTSMPMQRAHGAVAHRRHRSAPLDDESHRIGRLQCMRRNRRRVLADAVTRDRDDVEVRRAACSAARTRRAAAPAARSRWGGDARRHRRARRAGRGRTRVRAASISYGDGEVGQPVRHSGGLAALSGKAECDAGHRTGWLLGDDHFAAAIVAAVRADAMRDPRLAAARARRQRRHRQRVVRAPKVAAAL